jgi:hypothetical protein
MQLQRIRVTLWRLSNVKRDRDWLHARCCSFLESNKENEHPRDDDERS